MDYLLNNPFPKWIVSYNPPANWIVSYKIHLQMVNWIVYMIYVMSRQHLGCLFSHQKGKVQVKDGGKGN